MHSIEAVRLRPGRHRSCEFGDVVVLEGCGVLRVVNKAFVYKASDAL
jgi:hypothetical protein